MRALSKWTILISLMMVGLVGGLAWLGSEVGVRSALADRVLFTVPTLSATAVRFSALPMVRDRFRQALQPPTGMDSVLFVAPVQQYQPGRSASFVVESQPVPLPFPTTPPLILSADAQQLPSGCAPSALPADGPLNQPFHAYHAGIDIGVQTGTSVAATHSGYVVYAGWNAVGYGNLVVLQNDSFITYYAHNSEVYVQAGQPVRRGSIIALSGNTGNSTGPHVHYEIRLLDIPVDPLTFAERGYAGC